MQVSWAPICLLAQSHFHWPECDASRAVARIKPDTYPLSLQAQMDAPDGGEWNWEINSLHNGDTEDKIPSLPNAIYRRRCAIDTSLPI